MRRGAFGAQLSYRRRDSRGRGSAIRTGIDKRTLFFFQL